MFQHGFVAERLWVDLSVGLLLNTRLVVCGNSLNL